MGSKFPWYSDHVSISVSIRVNFAHNRKSSMNNWSALKQKRMDWNSETIESFKTILACDDVQDSLNNFCSSDFESSDEAAEKFTSILAGVVSKVFPKKSPRKSKKNSPKIRKNFSYECVLDPTCVL